MIDDALSLSFSFSFDFGLVSFFSLLCVWRRDEWLDNRPPSGARKETSGGLAISMSACGDDQFAADTSVRPHIIPHLLLRFFLLSLLN